MGGIVMSDGSLLFWSAPSDPRNADIFVAPAVGTGFGRPVPIGAPINTPAFESAAAMSPDGRLLVFQREGAADGMGKEDLYVAKRTGAGWGEPRLLGGGISTSSNESFPSFTPDGASLVFSSDRGGNWSIYVVSVASFASTGRR
jgi:Tol biopolymer transport system component